MSREKRLTRGLKFLCSCFFLSRFLISEIRYELRLFTFSHFRSYNLKGVLYIYLLL